MDTLQMNDWLGRWRSGDEAANEELMRAAYPRLEALARKMLRGFPRVRRLNDTGDVLHNAVMRLARSLRRIDPPPASTREFFGLAAAEIRHELLDLTRAMSAAKRRGEFLAGEDSPLDEAPEPRDPGELDRWADFHEAVACLPAEEREVVGLLFYHGWTHAQVAELFGVAERTVGRRWHGALLLLTERLGGRLPGGPG